MTSSQTDRYFIGNKVITKKVFTYLFVIEMKEIYVHVYKIVHLLKSFDNIHGMTYTTKIMLCCIAIIKTVYFDI